MEITNSFVVQQKSLKGEEIIIKKLKGKVCGDPPVFLLKVNTGFSQKKIALWWESVQSAKYVQ